ncbi:kinase-like domain-containing protein [Mycena latifolia]|nr:kinase-like domain-containing protein [Mycena latifolia]
MSVNAFQISGLLSIQSMLGNNEMARNEDANVLNARLKALERNQVYLRDTLEIKQDNMIAMMACIQRRLDSQQINPSEQKFYSHTLQYLTTMSGQQVKLEDWMIASFDVEYGTEIGFGGFGKVYRGTWNQTNVAIKVLHTGAGITPSLVLLRKEIDIWLTLRHPNILQFLGANTLDNKPFIVMPYIPNNARQFLKQQPTFDPAYILRDISLGLQYLHLRKICHGDIKGINILVEDSGRSLLCDFGLSRVKADITARTTQVGNTIMAGSRNWMAPELLTGSLPKLPSDIYAFGMTMYELYTDETPLASVAHTDFIEVVFRLRVRPTRPHIDDGSKLTDPLWTLAELCWLHDAMARPTAGKIHDMIRDMISQMTRDTRTHARTTATHKHEDRPQVNSKDLEKAAMLNSKLLERKQVLGEDHPQTLSTMAQLVYILPGLGRAKEAEELGVPAIRKMKQVLGESHPDTLRTMYNLTHAYSKLGQHKEAEELGVTVMMRQKQVVGEDHPDTLRTMQNLVHAYSHLGRHKEAEELGVTAMMKRKQVLGEDHPDTLWTMATLATTYFNLGQFKEAEELAVTVMKKQKQVLGEDHPDTLRTMGNLANTYFSLGQFKETKELELMVMKKQKQTLGEDHPDTLQTMYNLAHTYFNLSQYKEAEKLGVTVMKKRKQVLGEHHLDTLRAMQILARTYSNLGQFKEAEELEVTVMKKAKQFFGEDDPVTLQIMSNLVDTLTHLRRAKEAAELGVQVLRRRKKVFGEDHPKTLNTMTHLANAYASLGQWKEVKDLAMTVMEKRKQVLGEDHPDTLRTMSTLTNTYLKLGKLHEAEELALTVIKKQKESLREAHPGTLRTMGTLVAIYKKQGKSAEAQSLSDSIKRIEFRQKTDGFA